MKSNILNEYKVKTDLIKIVKRINKSVDQLKKIAITHKNNTGVRIRLSYEQIKGNGKYKILLNKTQKENLNKSKKQKKGLVLDLYREQTKADRFLPILIGIATAIGALAGAGAAIANSVISAKHQKTEEEETQRHNAEIEKIAQKAKTVAIGAGFKK